MLTPHSGSSDRGKTMSDKMLHIALVLWLAVASGNAKAEIHKCDGKWTNGPCKGEVTSTMNEIERPDSVSSSPDLPNQDEDVPVSADKGLADSNDGCAEDETFVKTRETPVFLAASDILSSNNAANTVRVAGTVAGRGKVMVRIVGNGLVGSRTKEETKWTRVFNLPAKGGEKEFSAKFKIHPSWGWNTYVANIGSFEGYCTTSTEEQAWHTRMQKYTKRDITDLVGVVP